MKSHVLTLSIVALSCVWGCAPQPPTGVTWNRDSREAILAFQKEVVPPTDLNYALCELNRGLLFYHNGDFFHSDSRFANGLKVMDRIREDQGKETTAVVWDERVKVFKGEPYERAMAYFCRGLCHFNTGDYSGALAAFRSSLAADTETRNKETRLLEDFTISHFMAALCYSRLGEPQNAEAALRMARAASPNNPFLNPTSLRHNFIALVGVGNGPYKIGARKWAAGPAPEARIELALDGKVGDDPAEAVDLLAQAKSQTWGEADTARVARQVGKAVLSGVLSGLTGVNVNIEDYEDIRSWGGLSLKYYLFTAAVPPGNHTVSLRAFDKKGKELEYYRQIWFNVPTPAEKAPVLCLTCTPYIQNCFGLQLAPIKPQGAQTQSANVKGK